jgi:DNA-3-methyladenine glycosylase
VVAGEKLTPQFFARATPLVAKDLLGKEIVRKVNNVWLRARIVETEAYLCEDDPACHAFNGPTKRTSVMFGPPGRIYVYFIYGNYFMLNFVTEKEGSGAAVLIRAVEPVEGETEMFRLRGLTPTSKSRIQLTSGPAKLCLALGVDKTLNGLPLDLPHLAVVQGRAVPEEKIRVTTRIGISKAKELPLRFYEQGNPFVSKK